MAKSRKKPSAAQLRARAKFSSIMKSGGFGKRRKSSKKRVVRRKSTTAKPRRRNRPKPSATRRSRGGSASDINKTLLLDDISKIGISTVNKMKIIRSISKRLKI